VLKKVRFHKGHKAPPVVLQTIDSTKLVAVDTVGKAREKLLEVLMPLWNYEPEFSTFNSKVKIDFEGKGQKQDLIAHIRIRKDSVIWASVSAMGGVIQVARVLITADTIKMVDYLDKKAIVLPMNDAQKLLPAKADFKTLQHLILGTVLRKQGNVTAAYTNEQNMVMVVEDSNAVQQAYFNTADTSLAMLQMQSPNENGPAGVVLMSDYQLVDGRKFATKRKVQVQNTNNQFLLGLDFNNTDFDNPLEFPFSIPKNYKRK
jgi:hypothetical protein